MAQEVQQAYELHSDGLIDLTKPCFCGILYECDLFFGVILR